MRQHINLYARLTPVKSFPKALVSIGVVCLLVFFGYAGAAGYLIYNQGALASSLASAKAQNSSLKREVADLKAQDQAIDLALLEQKLAQQRLRLRRQQTLLVYLDGPAVTSLTGFSDAMTGLARQHVPGVAIEKFELSHEGRRFSMSGKLRNPTSLPIYVEKLGSEAAFAKMSIEKINITELDGYLNFEVVSLAQARGES
jgi:MSHA biogenesis protein MshI